MSEFLLKERLLPLDDSWDVIVAGGGPAGCAAAIAAAREGAKTLLIEATGSLGGMGTMGLVPTFCPFSDKEKIIYRGIAEKVLEACKASSAHIPDDKLDWVEINPEQLKLIYDELVTKAGVEVLFNTQLCAVENSDESTVSAIIVSNKAGLTAYQAKVYLDCTGDADLAAWAGAEFQKGSETGELQPATHCFTLANVDEYAYLNGEILHNSNPRSPVHKIIADENFPL
ncbi:MAG TPA: FAD-dependent oxidoreductase, partial [Bacillota bacterium]|nr:FAD-dependent oxidoreductase [Bacillota bacterium]